MTRPKTLQELLHRALQERNLTNEVRRWYEMELSRLVLVELTEHRDLIGRAS